MATPEQGAALLDRLNTATNQLAAMLQGLRDQLAAGGLTAEQETEFVAKLDTAIGALEAMGKDPADPIPETPA